VKLHNLSINRMQSLPVRIFANLPDRLSDSANHHSSGHAPIIPYSDTNPGKFPSSLIMVNHSGILSLLLIPFQKFPMTQPSSSQSVAGFPSQSAPLIPLTQDYGRSEPASGPDFQP
jgi:hypothetical protein